MTSLTSIAYGISFFFLKKPILFTHCEYYKWRQLILLEDTEDILGKLKNNQFIEHSCQFMKTNYLMTNVFN